MSFANEVSEAALAHVLRNKAEATYARSDRFEKPNEMMEAWEKFNWTTGGHPQEPERSGRRG
jgi:hypothetical protein